jgi:hypothetical protein
VWQYGRNDVGGKAPGLLSTPDGMDFLSFADAMRIPDVRSMVLQHEG